MPPTVTTNITRHTLWQALTGELPPMALKAAPIGQATLDSRDVLPGDLFVALAGQQTDGHNYIGSALDRGAYAVICEERGRIMAQEHGATVIDCTCADGVRVVDWPAAATADSPLVYVVNDAVDGLQRVGGFQRLHRTDGALRVIGITGSVGKTSTKELTAAVVRRRYRTLATQGNLNSEQGLPLTLLGLTTDHECAVLEMGMYALGEIARLCELARPQIGVVTNVGPSHLSRLGSMERIAQAKGELPAALPPADEGGVAILNWDDERVRPMADNTPARVFRYGLTEEADLWADGIASAGLDGIRFRFHHRNAQRGRVETLSVRVPLLGRHSVHTALRAASVGLVQGLEWDEIIAGMQDMPSQLRLVVNPGIQESTIIDDTYNASPASTVAALNLLADLTPERQGRRVAVLGDMLELGDMTDEGHKLVGRRAATVVDLLVTVGELGRNIGDEARIVGFPGAQLHQMDDASSAIALLKEILRPDDLVLVKGSRAIGMERIVTDITASR